jgi:SNF2 family DNA or RNA helicase
VELTPEQQGLYVQIRDEAFAMLESGSFMSTATAITQILRLHQLVCGSFKDDDGNEHDVPSNRLEVFMDVVEEVAGKVIVWAKYRRDIARIVDSLTQHYGPASVAQFHGGNTKTRQDDVARFLNDPECRFMISNQQTGGYGNTWIVANTVIYYSNDYDLELRMQSEDRAHRGGQTQHVTYVDLVAPGTVDERIIEALRNKIDISTMVMGDGYREWLV